MVNASDSGASAPGSSPGLGHCVVFLDFTLLVTLSYGLQVGQNSFQTSKRTALHSLPWRVSFHDSDLLTGTPSSLDVPLITSMVIALNFIAKSVVCKKIWPRSIENKCCNISCITRIPKFVLSM